jgi:hypothetical protein
VTHGVGEDEVKGDRLDLADLLADHDAAEDDLCFLEKDGSAVLALNTDGGHAEMKVVFEGWPLEALKGAFGADDGADLIAKMKEAGQLNT